VVNVATAAIAASATTAGFQPRVVALDRAVVSRFAMLSPVERPVRACVYERVILRLWIN
jgi:hypothetical protein